MSEPLRVLHLVTTRAYAGLERHVVQLTRDLRGVGVEAELACPPAAFAMREQAERCGIPVSPAERKGARWPLDVGRSIRRDPPDILHVHDGKSAAMGAAMARLSGTPLVRTQHFTRPGSVERAGWRGSSSRAVQRAINRTVRGYIGVSAAATDAAGRRGELGAALVTVIPPGVDLADEDAVAAAERWRSASEVPVVAYVGRLEPEKHLETFVDAMPRVLADVPQCEFVIAGTGSAEAALRARTTDLGVGASVRWEGWVAASAEVLRQSHVYVNTWPWEGFGMAMAEAMGFGLPVVAVDSGASPELVTDGVNGFVVAPDDADGLAGAIRRLITDRDLAVRMGREGRDRAAAEYSASLTAERTLAFYRSLVGGAG